MANENTSNVEITSDLMIIQNQYFSNSGGGYEVTTNISNITINQSIFVAAGGGDGGNQYGAGYNGKNGGTALTIHGSISESFTVTNLYVYGFLTGGGGGGGTGNDNAVGGKGGSGGGGGGGGYNNYISGTSGGNYNETGTNDLSQLTACGGGSYGKDGGRNSNVKGGNSIDVYGGGGGCGYISNGNDSTLCSGGSGGISDSGGGGGAGGGAGGTATTYGGGGGGSGGGKGGNGALNEYYGGDGGFGINCEYFDNITNLYNGQSSNQQGSYVACYMGPLYITGSMPVNYYIVIYSENAFGQLFSGPASLFRQNTIQNFYIAPSSYQNVANIMENYTTFTFTKVFYNNGAPNSGDNNQCVYIGNYNSLPFSFSYNNYTYTYSLSNNTTNNDTNSIDLIVNKSEITSTRLSNNNLTTSTLNIFGNISMNPSYSNTIIGIQMGIASSQNMPAAFATVYFTKEFPSANIIVQLTPYSYVYESEPPTPILYTVTSTYFTWFSITSSATNVTYNISWIAICYE